MQVQSALIDLAKLFISHYYDETLSVDFYAGLMSWYTANWFVDILAERHSISPADIESAFDISKPNDPSDNASLTYVRDLMRIYDRRFLAHFSAETRQVLEAECRKYTDLIAKEIMVHSSLDRYLDARAAECGMGWAVHSLACVMDPNLIHHPDFSSIAQLCAKQSALLNDLLDVERDAADGSPNAVVLVEKLLNLPREQCYRIVADRHDRLVSELDQIVSELPQSHPLSRIILRHLSGFLSFSVNCKRYSVGIPAILASLEIDALPSVKGAAPSDFLLSPTQLLNKSPSFSLLARSASVRELCVSLPAIAIVPSVRSDSADSLLPTFCQ